MRRRLALRPVLIDSTGRATPELTKLLASGGGGTGPAGPTGPTGPQGPQGDPGPAGSNGTNGTNGTNGVGVPVGGTTNQVLRKKSATDFDTEWATPSGGSDPWTYVKLGSDFVTGSATAVDVTGMAFTPAANTTYEIEGTFFFRTATATVGPRPGVAWPTGATDGVVYMQATSAAGTVVMQNGNINAAVLGPVGGLPNTTQSWPAQFQATLIVGASPSGNFKIQLATETAATNVTMKAGSWFKFRTVP